MAVIARDAQRDVLFWRRRERLGNGVGIASPPIRLQRFRVAAPPIDSARVARCHRVKCTRGHSDNSDLRQGLDAPNNEAVGVRILSVPCPATARQQRAARGVPWAELERFYPSVFVVVGLGGLALDAAMFCTLTFLRPSGRTIPYTVTYHLLFHGFTFYAMAQRIGYVFPTAMICSSLLLRLYQPPAPLAMRRGSAVEMATSSTALTAVEMHEMV